MGLGFTLAALPFALACGGVVETSHEPGESTPKSTTGTSGKSGTSGNSTDDPDSAVDLGDCKLGAKENYASDAPCAWVADGHCYDNREMACNCACPRSHNSQCISGFESGPNGHVAVVCN